MKRAALVIVVVTLLLLGLVASAYAYQEGSTQGYGASNPRGLGCTGCHGVADPSMPTASGNGPYRSGSGRQYVTGPHGLFTDMTDKCSACHDVHEALGTFKLLPADTAFAVCNSCHDMSWTGTGGTNGGSGVYGAMRSRGVAVGARHNIGGYNNTDTAPIDGSVPYEATQVIPGSDLASLATSLTCTDCHTPHGNTQLAYFRGERKRTQTDAATETSNKLLKDDLVGAPHGTYTIYGSAWCAACHNRRHYSSTDTALYNHPVELTLAYADQAATSENTTWQTYIDTDTVLPARQAGWSREATIGSTWKPLCQQCHYSTRDVEAPFQVSSADGTVSTDNPRFQTFPHESAANNFLVESGDDLCLNCHATSLLP